MVNYGLKIVSYRYTSPLDEYKRASSLDEFKRKMK